LRLKVVVGGCIVDIVSRCLSPILGNEASNPAAISQTFGGVGRNIAGKFRYLPEFAEVTSLFYQRQQPTCVL